MSSGEPQNEVNTRGPVTRNTKIGDALETRVGAGKVLREAFGLPCDECVVSFTETIEEGARYYNHDADAIVAKLNECPLRPPEPDEDVSK